MTGTALPFGTVVAMGGPSVRTFGEVLRPTPEREAFRGTTVMFVEADSMGGGTMRCLILHDPEMHDEGRITYTEDRYWETIE